MKRLLAQTGITYFSVLAVAFYLSAQFLYIALALSASVAVLFFCIKKTRKTVYLPAMAAAALLALTVNIAYTALFVQPITEKFSDGEHLIEAKLIDEPYTSYSRFCYRLKAVTIDGENVSTPLLLKTSSSLEIEIDDTVMLNAELNETTNTYYRSKGYLLSVESFTVSGDIVPAASHSLYYYAVKLRTALRSALDILLPKDCSDLCRAIFIGDKYALGLDVRDSFRYSGVSYFIVVSGMHFSVLCLLIYGIMRRLKNRIATFCVTLLFILVYMAVTGFQPSVVRAGLMMTVAVIGSTVRRKTYPLNHLGLAGFVLPLVFSPYGAGDAGLILSFYATMSVLLWAEPIAHKLSFKNEYGSIYRFYPAGILSKDKAMQSEKPTEKHLFLKKLYNAAVGVLAVTVSANILVLPISVFMFGGFSLVTLFSSLLLYVPIYLILILSLFLCIFYQIPFLRFLAVGLSYPLFFLCRLVLLIVESVASLPFSYIRIISFWFYMWLAVCVILAIWVLYPKNGYKRLPCAAFMAFILILAIAVCGIVADINTLRLEIYSCDDGMYVGINSGGSLHILSLDARGKAMYSILGKISHRYTVVDTVVCSNRSKIERLSDYTDREFAISDYLLYYNESDKNTDGAVLFDSTDEVCLADNLHIRGFGSGSAAVIYAVAGDTELLVLPSGTSAEDVPESCRNPDILITSQNADNIELLSCSKLIVNGSSADFDLDLSGICNEIVFTDSGDLYEDLR